MKPQIQMKTRFVILFVLFVSVSCLLVWAKANPSVPEIKEGRIIIEEPQKNGSFFISSANSSQNEVISPVLRTDFSFNALFVEWQAESAEISKDFDIYVQFLNENWSDWLKINLDDDYNGKDNSQNQLSSQMLLTKLTDSFKYKIVFHDKANKEDLKNLQFVYLDTTKGPKKSFSISTQTDGLNIIPREAWGADENYKYDAEGKDLWEEEYYTPQKFVIHHTAGEGNNQDPMAAVRAIHYWHSISKGWGDIGYNYLIDSQGNIYEGRRGGDGVVAGHAYMRNRNTIGIAIIGCYDDTANNCNTPDKLTAATQASLNKLIAVKAREFNIDPLGKDDFHGETLANVIGHRDVGSTVCPGNLIYNQLQQTKQLAYNIIQDLGGYKSPLPAAAQFVRQSAKDITVEDTKTGEITVEFKNTGQAVWRGYEDAGVFIADSSIKNKMAKIGSVNIALVKSANAPELVAYKLVEGNVYPGETGQFKLTLAAPADKKTETDNFTLAWQNKGYFPETDFSVSITKVACTSCNAGNNNSTPVYAVSLIDSTFPSQMPADSLQAVTIRFKNTGNKSLAKNSLKLHLVYEKTHISPFKNDSWYSEFADITPQEEQIYPDSTATFQFNLKSPNPATTFPHTLTLLYNDQVLYSEDKVIEVTSAYASALSENTIPIAVRNTWRPKVKLTFTNTGTETWLKPTLKSYDIDGTNSWFRDSSWQDNKTIKKSKTEVKPGESISFEFYLKPYWKPNNYPHVYKLFDGEELIDINGKKEFLTYTRVDK